jgi:hypothetical protein
MSIQTTLRNLRDAEQITLVQDVLRGDEDAIATFLRCIQRLLTRITRHAWGEDDIVFVPPEDAVDQLTECVLDPLTHLIYGLRSTGSATSSPLQYWLDQPDPRTPLDKYVACVVRNFLRDRRRMKAKEKTTISECMLHTYDDTDGRTINYYDAIKDETCPIEDEIAVYSASQLWWEQRTPAERTLLHLLSPEGEDLTLDKAAEQRGTSITTLHRRRKHLRDDFVAFLNAA